MLIVLGVNTWRNMVNEKIKEFAIRAREYADAKFVGTGSSDWIWQDEYHNRFAQLIIQECIDISQNLENEYLKDRKNAVMEDKVIYNEGMCAAQHIKHAIMRKFDIKKQKFKEISLQRRFFDILSMIFSTNPKNW